MNVGVLTFRKMFLLYRIHVNLEIRSRSRLELLKKSISTNDFIQSFNEKTEEINFSKTLLLNSWIILKNNNIFIV